MRLHLFAAGMALALAPGMAMAQSNAATEKQPTATDLKGPPNANGFDKERGMDKTGTAATGEEKASDGTKMHGSPNADGYKK